ncbi:MAG: AmmeMemoRadiSam system protein B [Candidatus Omnitrophica bacterium]|nr:AmmeMemoRadiSam system protein B [Candidatus Omnitrophota bacterium]
MAKLIFLSLCFLIIFSGVFAQSIKEADLAGSWYPDDPQILKKDINDYLKNARVEPLKGEVIALICPHAGLIYSGNVAAYGFKVLENKEINTVVLIGFSHEKDFDGIAVFSCEGFKTPLGVLTTDKKLIERISSAHKKIFTYPKAFENENSIELILPFIQTAFNKPKVLLLALGRQSWENCEILGEALAGVLEDESNFLIIASTDMSHYLSLSLAEKADASTADLMGAMDPKTLFSGLYGQNRMCGLGAVVSTMIAAKKIGANRLEVLKKSTSAEISGDKEKVVGYLSAAMIKDETKRKENQDMDELLNKRQKEELLKLVRDTITLYLNEGKILEREPEDEVFKTVMGIFVTLRRNHQLRGCIGNIIGTKPLYLEAQDMAIAASTRDSRFPSVTKEELKDIHIEISVLSPLKKITGPEEIILGKHGVLVRDNFRSGVYLPQVATETGWNKEEFMNSLCGHKAQMAPDAWKKGECDIYIFSAEVFEE